MIQDPNQSALHSADTPGPFRIACSLGDSLFYFKHFQSISYSRNLILFYYGKANVNRLLEGQEISNKDSKLQY
jgi:hypothetical protein